jgi:hypothetical protein
MAKFKVIENKISLGETNIVKVQLMIHCFVKGIVLSSSELDCLTLLAKMGDWDLSDFCEVVVSEDIFSSSQTVRNCIVKMERLGFIVKSGKSKKRVISINPSFNIVSSGNIFLNYKMFHVATEKD